MSLNCLGFIKIFTESNIHMSKGENVLPSVNMQGDHKVLKRSLGIVILKFNQKVYTNYAVFISYYILLNFYSKTILNFCPSIGNNFSSDGQIRILNPWVQCFYVRENIFYVSPTEKSYQVSGEAEMWYHFNQPDD